MLQKAVRNVHLVRKCDDTVVVKMIKADAVKTIVVIGKGLINIFKIIFYMTCLCLATV